VYKRIVCKESSDENDENRDAVGAEYCDPSGRVQLGGERARGGGGGVVAESGEGDLPSG
jgi:hypothetical protein